MKFVNVFKIQDQVYIHTKIKFKYQEKRNTFDGSLEHRFTFENLYTVQLMSPKNTGNQASRRIG